MTEPRDPTDKTSRWAYYAFQQGERVVDRITGATGVVTQRIQYLHGCNRYGVQPYAGGDQKGQPEPFYVDEPQLETDHSNGDPLAWRPTPVHAGVAQPALTGGDQPKPVYRQAPKR